MTDSGDILHALSHRHENTWTAFVEPVGVTGHSQSTLQVYATPLFCNCVLYPVVAGKVIHQVSNMLVEFHPSETNISCWAQTWTACLTLGDTNRYSISPPPRFKWSQCYRFVPDIFWLF